MTQSSVWLRQVWVVVSTKSGSNEFHGSAFEYMRNNSPGFQSYARNPFNSAENNTVPPVKWISSAARLVGLS